jgi:hypothetical protein
MKKSVRHILGLIDYNQLENDNPKMLKGEQRQQLTEALFENRDAFFATTQALEKAYNEEWVVYWAKQAKFIGIKEMTGARNVKIISVKEILIREVMDS